jgi:hypothetical protein
VSYDIVFQCHLTFSLSMGAHVPLADSLLFLTFILISLPVFLSQFLLNQKNY